jgi:hypothetical protein
MSSMFRSCHSLTTIPQLDTFRVENMNGMFYFCYSLTAIPQLDVGNATNMINMFYYCYSLAKITLSIQTATDLSSCSLLRDGIVNFFNSLPTITSSKAITLTGNPGVSDLTADDKAIATNKNWTLTL